MQMLEIRYPDKPPRYFIAGRRVSAETWELTIIKANMQNKRRDCFHTKCKDLGGGNFKRYNYSHLEE